MNTILTLSGAIGLFLIVMGLLENLWRPKAKRSGLAGLESAEPLPTGRRALSPYTKLESLLYQARAPITVPEFVFTSLGLGSVLALVIFWVSGALLLSLVMFLMGAFLYYLYLTGRRDRLARQYEEIQPQVVYTLYFYIKSHGLDLIGAVKHVAQSGPEIVRDDWRILAAAVSQERLNVDALNQLLTQRSSPSFTRIVEALLLFRDANLAELPQVLEDLRRDISLEVEIARENAAGIFGARRQLLWVALMPVGLAIVFILMMPTFKAFYQSLFGQLLLLGLWGFSGAVYLFGSRAASKASSLRPYSIMLPEERPASTYLPLAAGPDLQASATLPYTEGERR
jgi:tight adherence protein B